MSTDTMVGTLSADDVAALRMASSVTFHHYQGHAFIRAYIRPEGRRETYTQRQQILFPEPTSIPGERHRDVTVSGSISGYGKHGGGWRVDSDDVTASAFHMITSARFAPTWVTIAALLTAGETVALEWIADNNTENHDSVGFHCDQLQLTATKGKRTRVFSVAERVGPDNSARMIRRHG